MGCLNRAANQVNYKTIDTHSSTAEYILTITKRNLTPNSQWVNHPNFSLPLLEPNY